MTQSTLLDKAMLRARVANIGGEPDCDRETFASGSLAGQDVLIGAWNHASWQAEPPAGKGTLAEDQDGTVVLTGEWFDTDQGRETRASVKAAGESVEWSVGMAPGSVQRERYTAADGKAAWRITQCDVREVSPVLAGCQAGTGTLEAKQGSGTVTKEQEQQLLKEAKGQRARDVRRAKAALGKGAEGLDDAAVLAAHSAYERANRDHVAVGPDALKWHEPGAPVAEEPSTLRELATAVVEHWREGQQHKTVLDVAGATLTKALAAADPSVKADFTTTSGWEPEHVREPGVVIPSAQRMTALIDLFPTSPARQTNIVRYMSETTHTSGAAARSEGAVYPESTYVLTEQQQPIQSIGSSIPVTDEQLEDVTEAAAFLERTLLEDCRRALESQLWSGSGTAPNLRGLSTAVTQTMAAGTDSPLDAIRRACDVVRYTGRSPGPDAVVLHPTDWRSMRLATTTEGEYLLGAPAGAGPAMLWAELGELGLRVVVSDLATQGTAVVGDFARFSRHYVRRGLVVEVGYVNDDFVDGRRTFRAGLRSALAVYRPAAFVKVTGI